VAYGSGSLLVSNPSFDMPPALRAVGRAYLFDSATGGLVLTLPNPEPKTRDIFGGSISSLAVFGNRVVVGASDDDLPGDDRPDGDNPGRAWIFDRLTGASLLTIENPNPQKGPPHFFQIGLAPR
jgi:hypothetical protein